MEIKVKSQSLLKGIGPGAVLVLGHFEGDGLSAEGVQVDKACDGIIRKTLDANLFSGKFLTHTLLQTNHASLPHILLLGLGPAREITPNKIRQALGIAATTIRETGLSRFFIAPHAVRLATRISISDIVQAMVEGVLLALYQFNLYKTDRKETKEIKEVCLIVPPKDKTAGVERAVLQGEQIANAVNMARDLCTLPANVLTPTRLVEEANRLADAHPAIRVSVLERAEAQQLGMGAFVGVAQGSNEPPKFIVIDYQGARGKPVALVGKSVTFDTGGISIKPSENMEQMKYDMSGGAAVLGAMKVAAQMQLPLHIVGILPATDNMPSGHAIHPGDIVTTLSGKTVEVINTDAEGRLCLADAITYALRYKPHTIIDLATLTGACTVALGHQAMALFSNDPKLEGEIQKASEATGERVWPLPLWDEYFDQIKSDVADLKNTGGRPAGSITAALFLKQFAKDVAWAHLDIAGVAWNSGKPQPYNPKGSTGAGVRLLVRYLMNLVKP